MSSSSIKNSISKVQRSPQSGSDQTTASVREETALDRVLDEIRKADAEIGREVSLTCAVQLARPWIGANAKRLGWERLGKLFCDAGFPHANSKNTRQAFEAEDSHLVQALAKTDEGRLFAEALEALSQNQPAPPLKTAVEVAREARVVDAAEPRDAKASRQVEASREPRNSLPVTRNDASETPSHRGSNPGPSIPKPQSFDWLGPDDPGSTSTANETTPVIYDRLE